MDIDILYEGAFAMARLTMKSGEQIITESGAMVAMSPTLTIEGKARGGLLKSLGRAVLTGESFFQSTITAEADGELLLASSTPGDIVILETGQGWTLQKGAFLASLPTVEVKTKGQGLKKGLFGGEGFFILQAEGEGPLVVASYGAIHKKELAAGEEYVVDNGHLVAWNCEYEIKKAASGWLNTIKSGEGFVARCKGPGTLYLQSRNLGPLARALTPFLPNSNS